MNGGVYHVVQAGPSRFEVFPGKKPAAPVEPNAFPIGKDGMPLRKAIVPLSQADALIALMDGNKIIFNRDVLFIVVTVPVEKVGHLLAHRAQPFFRVRHANK